MTLWRTFAHCCCLATWASSLFTRDPKDDKFVACGLSGGAEYLVSYDDNLLVLGVVGSMQIGTPEAFVRDLWDTAPWSRPQRHLEY